MINWKIAVCLVACSGWKNSTYAQSTTSQQKNIHAPVRIAFVPGLSSQGKNDKHTISNLSLNVLGGATGGVNGVELGTLFNINKMNMQGVQAAGYFNITGGDVNGLQMASLFNSAKNNLTGIQLSGKINYVKKNSRGLQAAGLYNQVSGSITGAQLAGICNYTRQSVTGMQLAGIANINNSSIKGMQLSGILNYTKHLKGLQLGLINIADTSNGYSIGLINIVKKGYHKITLSSNEVLNTNLALKSGNAKLYNILLVGVNAGGDEKSFSYGYGIGHEIKVGKRFTINPEITSQYLYLGDWDYTNLLNKFQVLATVKLAPGIALFAGPSFAAYYTDQTDAVKGYKFLVPNDNYNNFKLWNDNFTGWIGWTAGISLL
ncbi:hypothetical protein FAM09_08225 [Niastella caeni]|uniref:Uncharacterized protein n=1 Tax=Niastella caeni TaxID=2569763 RepID=A0A4S8HW24_9BACT|nr:hypothetical protein [Niastella caeni]THU39873.1 hypothetical protein FAM09_08225 [Niastella caeni]